MKTRIHWLCVPILAWGTIGCIDVKNHYVLNPDGSGKVIHESEITPMSFTGDDSDPDATGRNALKQMVEESKGVDAWSDASFNLNDDGTVTLKGTAYFPDLNAVTISSGGMTSDSRDFVLSREADGTSVLKFYETETGAEEGDDAAQELSDEEVAAELAKSQAEYKHSKPMVAAMLSTMRVESNFQLPGNVTRDNNVTMDGNKATVVFEGTKVMEAMDAIYADEAWLTDIVKSGKNPMAEKEAMAGSRFNELLFGAPGPVEVAFDPGTSPQFDYAAEVEAAKAGLEAMLAASGIQAPVPIEAAPGGGFASIMVGGVQWVRYEDQENEIRPLNNQKGYQLSVIADLGGAALDVGDGEVTEALADDGSSLLPESDWNRKINFPRLSKNRDKVVFEVPLASPGEGVKGIQKIAGELTYTVGSTTKEVDLGLTSLAAGQQGTELGASIEKVEKSQWSEGYDLAIKLAVEQSKIKELVFYDSSGTKLATKASGYSSWGDATEFSYSSDTAFPTAGKVVALVYDDLVEYKAEFSLENLDLLGNPR